MKLVTASIDGKSFVGVLNKEQTAVLPLNDGWEKKEGRREFPSTMIACIQEKGFLEKVTELLIWLEKETMQKDLYIPIENVKLEAPIPRPHKNIMCVGKNYAEHAIEMGSKEDIPEHVMVFTKSPTTVIGPNDGILAHKNITDQLDYEGELAVIIGQKGTAIPKEKALDFVFGYTILNDITARDIQTRHKQYFIGKSLDASAPMGPWIVTKQEIVNPNELTIITKVNGEIRQQSNTRHFIFPIEEIIHVLSKGMTLEPGDVIATGTPAGVGKGFKPPRFLREGDQIEIEIEGIGVLTNKVVNTTLE